MNSSDRLMAFLTYLLVIIGSLFVLLFQRNNRFAVYHARQSLTLVLAAILIPAMWAAFSWIVTWIPHYTGAVTAASTFSLVIVAYIAIVIGWLAGMLNAVRGKLQPVPFFGGWASRLPG